MYIFCVLSDFWLFYAVFLGGYGWKIESLLGFWFGSCMSLCMALSLFYSYSSFSFFFCGDQIDDWWYVSAYLFLGFNTHTHMSFLIQLRIRTCMALGVYYSMFSSAELIVCTLIVNNKKSFLIDFLYPCCDIGLKYMGLFFRNLFKDGFLNFAVVNCSDNLKAQKGVMCL